jgi:esterase FrsA
MSYQFPDDPKATFSERTPQFVGMGIPKEEVDRLAEVITDMWADGQGGWCYEWSQLAARYAAAGQPWMAALAYGDARFPVLADEAKAAAMGHQLEQYTLASRDFPVDFERRVVTTRLKGQVVEVPVHVLSEKGATGDTPVLVVSGGVDSWKMDLHRMWISFILGAHVRVVAFDHPGTGELTDIPMRPDSTEIVDGLVAFARTLTRGRVGHLGVSFGGYFSAHSSLTEVVDAAVVVGGPVSTASFGLEHLESLMYGMAGIVGNALGFTGVPTTVQLLARVQALAMDDLFVKRDQLPDVGDQRRRRRPRATRRPPDLGGPSEHRRHSDPRWHPLRHQQTRSAPAPHHQLARYSPSLIPLKGLSQPRGLSTAS